MAKVVREKKYWDFVINPQSAVNSGGTGTIPLLDLGASTTIPMSTNGQAYTQPSLCNMPAGSNENQRIGNKIFATSLQLTIGAWTAAYATDGDQQNIDYGTPRIHWMIFKDKQSNGTYPNLGQILADPSTTGIGTIGATSPRQWPRNLPNQNRFVIYKRGTINFKEDR